MVRISAHRLILGLVLGLISQQSLAQTAAQLEMLRQLPASERAALIKKVKPATIKAPVPVALPELEADQPIDAKFKRKERVVEAGTAMLIDITRNLQTTGGDAAVTAATSSRYLVVDAKGEVDIAPMGRINLLGYTADEVVTRLRAEPTFAGASITLRLLPKDSAAEGALLPFGYTVFSSTSSSFTPENNIPVPTDYVLGPGDTIEVLLYGKENDQWTLPVTRDGTLEVPMLGPISVIGMRFDDLRTELTRRIKSQMIGVTPSITMGQLRSIRIFVAGDVANPGSYTVSSLSTITHALIESGGPTLIGSLRNIQLKRGGKTVGVFDLYNLLLHGDSSSDRRLLPGDTIFVPAVGPSVTVSGRVRRPAIYELKGESTLESVVAMAGGRMDDGDASSIQLERISQSGERLILDVSLSSSKRATETVHSGDVIRVQPVLDRREQVVRLVGHLERTGVQQWKEGMHLLDLIPDARMFKPRPDLGYILIVRENGPDKQKSVFSVNYLLAQQDPASAQNPILQLNDEIRVFGLEEDRSAAIKPIIDSLRNQSRSGALQRVVSISGQVAHAGDYPLEPGMKISDLVRASGQLLQSAYPLQAELTRFQVSSAGDDMVQVRINVDLSDVLAGHSSSGDLELQPLDVLQVRQIPDWASRRIVSIKGEVRFPGEYVVTKTETLADLIERAGGYTSQAYPKAAVFLREDLRKKEQAEMQLLQRKLQADIAFQLLGDQKNNSQGIAQAQQILSQLETAKAAGRLAIRLEKVKTDSDENLVLKDGDQLFVPPKLDSVTLIGEVNSPTSLRWKKRWDMPDYISKAGGLTAKADSSRIYVIKANGEVEANKTRLWFNYNQIEPGDTIVAPLDTSPISALGLATSISQVLYQIGLSVAAFRAVGAF